MKTSTKKILSSADRDSRAGRIPRRASAFPAISPLLDASPFAPSIGPRIVLNLALLALLVPLPHLQAGEGARAAALVRQGDSGRRYAPDRLVDILHLKIDVTPDFATRSIEATTTIRFTPISQATRELVLDAVDLEVSGVRSSRVIAGYHVAPEKIVVTFAEPVEPGEEVWVEIDYWAEPKQGLYFRTPELGYPARDAHLWTQGEAHESRHWYPSFDYPNERFTSEVISRIPADMIARSNGRIVADEIDPASGLRVVHWSQEKPHVSYLIALTAGYFESYAVRGTDYPMHAFAPASLGERLPDSFAVTAEVMRFFEEEIGVPYPWAKYDQVVVHDFTYRGMENTGLTILYEWGLLHPELDRLDVESSENLIAHELAHQWFGNYVTLKDWSHAWLNEGFAMYYAGLFARHARGQDAFDYRIWKGRERLIGEDDGTRPIVTRQYDDPLDQFNLLAYGKGAWVLHMLRARLGEATYRKIVRTYLNRHALGSVVTADLNRVIEEVSGRTFDPFFDAWVYGAGIPHLKVDYSWSESEGIAKISVERIGADVNPDDNAGDRALATFRFPLKIGFTMAQGRVTREMWVDKARQDFHFPLDEQPAVVRVDPGVELLAEIDFSAPPAMLRKELSESESAVARVMAAHGLSKISDGRTIAALGTALRGDAFHGVRIEATKALREIHEKEALKELAQSTVQDDARVRFAVVEAIADFYADAAKRALIGILEDEANPRIRGAALKGLALYSSDEIEPLLFEAVRTKSFRGGLAQAAMGALRRRDDPATAAKLLEALRDPSFDVPHRVLGRGLAAVGYLSRNLESRDDAFAFLTSYAEHPSIVIRRSAIEGLGELRDPRAIAIVRTFADLNFETRVKNVAEAALKKLYETKPWPAEVQALRAAVEELQEDHEKLEEDVQNLESRRAARPEVTGDAGSSKRKFLGIF